MRVVVIALVLAACLFSQQYPFVDVTANGRNASIMLLDHRGGLWVNVIGGLRYFDGQHWFSLQDVGFPAGVSAYLAEDSDGGIWLAAGAAGLFRFHQGHLAKMQGGYARDVIAVRPGLVLAFCQPNKPAILGPNLYRFTKHQGRWTGMQLADWKARSGDYPHVDSQGTVTYACPGAWCELPAQTIADWHPSSNSAPIRHKDVYPGLESVLRDRFGCLWFRSASLTTSYQCPGQPLQELPYQIAGGELDMKEASGGSVWIPSGSRLAIGRPGAWRVVRASNGLPDAEHTLVGPDGTIWIVGSNGVFRWPYPLQAEYWTARDGVDLAYSFLRVGNRMLAVAGAGISALSAERDRWLPLASSSSLNGVRALHPGPNQTFYADLNSGVWVQMTRAGSEIARSHSSRPLNFARAAEGPLWIGEGGVTRLVAKGSHLLFQPVKLSRATDQKLASCSSGGVLTLEEQHLHRIPTSVGLLNGCRSLKILPSGDIWLAYDPARAFALIRRDAAGHATVRQYDSGADVGEAYTYTFDTDSRGWLWRGGDNAMYVADPKSAEDGKWIKLDGVDGFRSTIIAANSSWSDPDGSVWWGTQDSSIYHFTPTEDFVRPTKPPSVFLSGYSWDGTQPKLSQTVHLIPHGANLTAFIGSLQFDRRNALRFRYRLDQSAWQETRSVDIALGQLHWGPHRLEMQAHLLNGPWSSVQSETFEIAQPFWAGWRFLLGCFAVIAASSAGACRRLTKRRARLAKAFPNLSEMRFQAFSPEVQGLVGGVLGQRYKLDRILARGGFSTVLYGEDLAAQNQPCAIKVFRQELSDKDWLLRHFEREVAILQQIRHRNVVAISGHGMTPEGSPYLVMEFIPGITLRELLGSGSLPPVQTALLLRQMGAALHAIHAHGICHRDLKPENLMIRSSGPAEESLVLIDFSIAIVRRPDETIHGLSLAAGTIYYMAPEQAIGFADTTTDIYSLSKVLVEMLTGTRLSELLPDASMDLPDRVRELLRTLSQSRSIRLSSETIELIATALEYDPAKRPRDAAAFASAIAADLDYSANPI